MRCSWQEYWSGLPLPSPGDPPNLVILLLRLLHGRWILYCWARPPRKPRLDLMLPYVAPFTPGKNYSTKLRKAMGAPKMCWRTRKISPKKQGAYGWQREKSSSSLERIMLHHHLSLFLKYFLWITFILYNWLMFPFPFFPFLHFLHFLHSHSLIADHRWVQCWH